MNLNRSMGGYAHGTTTMHISELHMEVNVGVLDRQPTKGSTRGR
jgi:hypothetical protein